MLQSWMIILGIFQYNVAHLDKPIEYYIHTFKAEQIVYAQSCQEDINIRGIFDDLMPGIVGYCDLYDVIPTIRIDRKYWAQATDLEREELVYHELGHCLLNRMHKEGYYYINNIEMPRSVMKCCGMLDGFYSTFHDYYINELFNGE